MRRTRAHGNAVKRGMARFHGRFAVLPDPAGHRIQGATELGNAQAPSETQLRSEGPHRLDQMADLK